MLHHIHCFNQINQSINYFDHVDCSNSSTSCIFYPILCDFCLIPASTQPWCISTINNIVLKWLDSHFIQKRIWTLYIYINIYIGIVNIHSIYGLYTLFPQIYCDERCLNKFMIINALLSYKILLFRSTLSHFFLPQY